MTRKLLKKYWFELQDENHNDLGADIWDGRSKAFAVKQAKAFMREHRIPFATLEVNDIFTNDIVDFIDIEIKRF